MTDERYLFLQAQHSLKKSDNALQTLDKAIAIDQRNPLCKFHRASILFAHDKYKVGGLSKRTNTPEFLLHTYIHFDYILLTVFQDALSELEELREIIPKESLVYFLFGKVRFIISHPDPVVNARYFQFV